MANRKGPISCKYCADIITQEIYGIDATSGRIVYEWRDANDRAICQAHTDYVGHEPAVTA